jgi:hypothetical protein
MGNVGAWIESVGKFELMKSEPWNLHVSSPEKDGVDRHWALFGAKTWLLRKKKKLSNYGSERRVSSVSHKRDL